MRVDKNGVPYGARKQLADEAWVKECKDKKAVYKLNYELVMGHVPDRAYKTVSRDGPSYRGQGATLNGQKL